MKFASLALLVLSSGLLFTRTTSLVIPRHFNLQDSSSQDNQYPLEVIYEKENQNDDYYRPCHTPTVSDSDPATPIGTITISISTTEVELDRVVLEERPVGEDGMVEIIEEIVVEEVVETVIEITYEIEVDAEEPVIQEPQEDSISEKEYEFAEISYIEENIHNSQFQDEDEEDAEAATSKITCTFNAENDVKCTFEGSPILPPNEEFFIWEENIEPQDN